MKRMLQMVSRRSAIPALVLGAALALLGPAPVMAQRGGGHSGGNAGRSFSGGGHSGGGYTGRSFSGGGRGYAAPQAGRAVPQGRSYYGGGYYRGGGSYYAGRFYPGRGYYWGGHFWARPYFGVGVGIPFGWGYYNNGGCGYYDGWGYWHPAPCYVSPYYGY